MILSRFNLGSIFFEERTKVEVCSATWRVKLRNEKMMILGVLLNWKKKL